MIYLKNIFILDFAKLVSIKNKLTLFDVLDYFFTFVQNIY